MKVNFHKLLEIISRFLEKAKSSPIPKALLTSTVSITRLFIYTYFFSGRLIILGLFWGQTTETLTGSSPKRDCGTKQCACRFFVPVAPCCSCCYVREARMHLDPT